MTLREARIFFTFHLAHLLLRMNECGYQPALAEVMDRKTPKDPTSDHMPGSLHDIGLAADIDLYDGDGNWLSKTEDHKRFGEWWEDRAEAYHLPLKWGGRFRDGNHYSFEWNGKS